MADGATYIQRAADYAQRVLTGKVPACEHVRNACARFKRDLSRTDIVLHEDGDKWCAFLEKLPHVKGRWASKGERFLLSDWQIFVTVNLYGWKRVVRKLAKTDYAPAVKLCGVAVRVALRSSDPGPRRFREGYIEVPRKNGKSFWVAGIGIAHITIDNETGAEVYCGATSEKQAWEVFRPAKQIVDRTPGLQARFNVGTSAKRVYALLDGGRFEPVIGKPGDGASPSCGIADEFHEHQDSDLVDTFVTGMGAREQPMMLYVTTAGADMGGPCYAKRDDVIKVLNGSVEDDTVFGIIYGLDEGDQWDTVEALRKANPNFGISVSEEFLVAQMEQARRSATRQVAFKTKHLNMWVGAKKAWMNMLAFQARRRTGLSEADYHGRPAYVALDLASVSDVANMAVMVPPVDGNDTFKFFVRHYLPEDTVLEGGNERYKAWHMAGHITATPGNVLDYEYIEEDLKQVAANFAVDTVAFDPFQATQFSTRMVAEGLPMVQCGATVKNFSEPMKMLERLVLNKQVEFQADPVLLWMFGNVVARLDKKDNVYPDKDRPENKIDGVVACIMCLWAWMNTEQPQSVGIEVVA